MSEQTYNDLLPNPGFEVEKGKTALVVTDPQRDFLSEDGVVWEVVGPSVKENDTVEHLRQLLSAAHDAGIPVFISPHYYYPQDKKWNFGGALEKMMHAVGMFDREGALTTNGFSGSGADWHEPLKSLIDRDDVIVTSSASAGSTKSSSPGCPPTCASRRTSAS
jgi:nicotinamidase-related amidase